MNRETKEDGPLTLEQSLQQAVALHQEGRFQEAGERYRTLLEAMPHHPEANHNMGALAVQMKQPAAGLPFFMAALEAEPTCAQYWLSYIDALFQAGQLETAREVLAMARQQGLQGDEAETLAMRLDGHAPGAGQTIAEGRYPAQQSSSEEKPGPQEMNAVAALFNQGQFAEAANRAQAMTERYPLNGFGWKVLGVALKLIGQSAEALAPMQKAAALSPDDAEAHYNLGILLQYQDRLDEAETSYRHALGVKPDYAEAHNNLGLTLHDLGRLDEAEEHFRRALEFKPGFAEAHSNLGNSLQDQGRVEEAAASYRRALEINPAYADAHCNLGIALRRLGRLDEAEASLGRALQIKPDYPAALSILNDIFRKQGLLPDYLEPEVFDFANGRVLRRYAPRESDTFIYIIEVSGTCNLRCPTCPVGNFPDASRPKGFMDLDLFRRIVEKIRQDSVVENPKVWLFNWGEPMLHPKLPEMIAILKQHQLYTVISTNLNIKKNLEEIIRSGPDEIKISLSGFTQAFYAKTHVKGNIELVKKNMTLVHELIHRFKVPTRVWVGHHLYRHNSHESGALKSLCNTLGFDYNPIPAFYQPLEKLVDLIEGKVSTSEADLLANLFEHPLEHLAEKRKVINPELDCELRFNMTTINYDGSVALCCGVYDYHNMLGVNFLEASHDEIQNLKYKHPFCKKCYGYGLQYSEPMSDH